MKTVRIGLAGFGTVGSAVFQHLRAESDLMSRRFGIRPVVTALAVRHPRRARAKTFPRALLVPDTQRLAARPDVDLVVEVMGGCGDARRLILSALKAGKPVVTANKAVLAEHGPALFAESRHRSVPLYFEASVAGGIPVIQALREGLVINRFPLIYGIVNGTCNYILTRMSQDDMGFDDALKLAQRLGYAETDPSFDIEGKDAAHKATVLASLAAGGCVDFRKVYVEGIRGILSDDIRFAHQLGYEIKLLAVIRCAGTRGLEVRVHPTLIPRGNRLASIHGATNSIMVRGHVVGDIEFSGPGAGGNATASAVLGDIAQASLHIMRRRAGVAHGACASSPCLRPHGPKVVPIGHVTSRYYLRLLVANQTGVMAKISSVLGRARIGICSVMQPQGHEGKAVPLIFMIHDARHDCMEAALGKIRKLSCIKARPQMLRVETFES